MVCRRPLRSAPGHRSRRAGDGARTERAGDHDGRSMGRRRGSREDTGVGRGRPAPARVLHSVRRGRPDARAVSRRSAVPGGAAADQLPGGLGRPALKVCSGGRIFVGTRRTPAAVIFTAYIGILLFFIIPPIWLALLVLPRGRMPAWLLKQGARLALL